MDEMELNRMLDEDPSDLADIDAASMEKAIRRNIKNQIYKRALTSILTFVLTVGALALAVSTAMSVIFYNPTRENGLLMKSEYQTDDFSILFTSFVNTLFPGRYVELNYAKKHPSKGFGVYEYREKVGDNTGHIAIDGSTNVTLSIHRSELTIDADEGAGLYLQTEQFRPGSVDQEEREDLLQNIEELPESSVLTVAVSFTRSLTADEAVAFMQEHTINDYLWAMVNTGTDFPLMGSYCGINLRNVCNPDLSEEAQTLYPNLFQEGDFYTGAYSPDGSVYTGEDLTTAFLSNLKLQLDHPEFTKVMYQTYFGNVSNDWMSAAYEKVSTKGLKIGGFLMNVQKDDLLEMMQEDVVGNITVSDVKLSILSK